MGIRRLNHAVLYVGDVDRSVEFYTGLLDFRVVHRAPSMAFLRAPGSDGDHDLGLFAADARPAPRGERPVGLCHLGWSVATLAELAGFARALTGAGALVDSADHVVSKSLYAKDPDGMEFEVAWCVPRDRVTPEMQRGRGTAWLDLDAEIRQWGAELVGAP